MDINNIDRIMHVMNFQSVTQKEMEVAVSEVETQLNTIGCYTMGYTCAVCGE